MYSEAKLSPIGILTSKVPALMLLGTLTSCKSVLGLILISFFSLEFILPPPRS